MSGLTEEAFRILAEFDDFERENVFSMLNAIVEPNGDLDQVWRFQRALGALIKGGYVTLAMESHHPSSPVPLSQSEAMVLITALDEWFVFDSGRQLWSSNKGEMHSIRVPVIVLTERGELYSREVLEDRGWRWWVPRRR